MGFTTNGIHKALAAAALMILLVGVQAVRADPAGRRALEADPRYKAIADLIAKSRAAEKDPDPRRRAGAVDDLAAIMQTQSAYETLLEQLKNEAAGNNQRAKAEYEELAEEWGVMRSSLQQAPILSELIEAIRTGNWTRPPLTEEQLQALDTQHLMMRMSSHCETLWGPQNRLALLPLGEQLRIQREGLGDFNKPWLERRNVCAGELNTKVIYAQHRLALGRCLTAHDYERVQNNTGERVHAEQTAFEQCMNENDIATAACTEDLKINTWVGWRRDPSSASSLLRPCTPVLIDVTPRIQHSDIAALRESLERVRAYASDPAKMVSLEKEAGGATPASFGLNTSIPFPTPEAAGFKGPANRLGVPVGAAITLTTLDPIDLQHLNAGRRYRTQLAGPAQFRGKPFLSKGVEVSIRVFKEQTTNPKFNPIWYETVEVVIDGQKYDLPGRVQVLGNETAVLPVGTKLIGGVQSALTPESEDPADANSPLLRAAPFPTDDPNFMRPEHRPEAAAEAPRPKWSLSAGGFNPPSPLPLPVATAEPVDLVNDDATLRFRAQTTAPVQYQGEVVVPADAEVFLKVIHKGRNRLFYQVDLTVDSIVVDGKKITVRTSQIERMVRIEPPAAPARAVRQQRLPPAAQTLPAGTQLRFSIAAQGIQ